MLARGITATSGRHGRSCEGRMKLHQTATPRTSAAKAQPMRGLRVSHSAQILNAKNVAASTSRSQAHGRFEKLSASVVQQISATRKRNPSAVKSQPRGLANQTGRALMTAFWFELF